MIEKKINLAIKQGLNFIDKETKKDLFLDFKTPFVAILMWQCLNTIDQKLAKKIVKLGVKRLIKEKNENWSFNYWLKTSEKYKSEPYPDDLDDTFGALSVIVNYDAKLIKGKDLAKIVNLLVSCEEKTGGPYKTWLVSEDEEKKWSDTDLAVNCNIGYFLKSQEIELRSINSLLEKAIREDNLNSPYYKGKWPIIYFASRFYKGKAKLNLVEIIEKSISQKNSMMEKAIALSGLIRLGGKNKTIWEELVKEISEIELCQDEDFYFYVDGEKKYIGHKALTTALVVEALSLYEQKKQTDTKKNKGDMVKRKVIKEVQKSFLSLQPKTKKQLNQILKKITEKENGDVILWSPWIVERSLIKTSKVEEKFLIKLSMINVLGWMAYTIYDDLMDGDRSINWLPTANIIGRKMDIMFTQLLPEESGFLKEYQGVMDNLEEANFWEMENCRGNTKDRPDFRKIEKLSDRSMGHALTSMAVLYKSEASLTDIFKLKTFFQFFLAARQMNDDAHDWEDDLRKGQINSASAEIFKLTQERKNYDELKLIFWEKVFDKYAKRILNYCEEAKKSLKQISCLKNTGDFDRMINKVIKSTEMATEEKRKVIGFINSYYQK